MRMRRVLVIGSGGSGKSTFARELGRRTGLPVLHLDAHFWRPGWVRPSPEEWRSTVRSLLAESTWIMDGNYGGTLEERVRRADAVIFRDMSGRTCIRRVIGRWRRDRGRVREDMPAGCPERLSFEFLRRIFSYPARHRPGILRVLGTLRAEQRPVTLTSPRRFARFLGTAVETPRARAETPEKAAKTAETAAETAPRAPAVRGVLGRTP